MTETQSQNVPFPECAEPMTLVRSKINGAEFKCIKHGIIVSVREAVLGVVKKKIGSLLVA